VEGGNGNGGGQKHAEEGRGGSVAGVDERRLAWPCAEESEGGRKEGAARWLALLKWRRTRQWRGEGPGVWHRVEERTGREGAGSRSVGDSTGGVGTAQPWCARAARPGHVARPAEQGRGKTG
jgi:hypothetical protein